MPPSADPPPPAVTPAPPDPGVASLYQEIILSHYRAPRHRGALPGVAAGAEHRNPLCGDMISVQLAVDGACIRDAAFAARACSITQATASMLLSRIIGGSVQDATAIVSRVEQLIESGAPLTDVEAVELGDLRSLASVARFPARKACVRLVTGALHEAIATG